MNLVFTGFMGTGKSKTGKVVAERLNRSFFDTDTLVEKKTGLSVCEIFEKFGESGFRRLEAGVIKEVSQKDSAVISCGGGTVLDSGNIACLKKKGIIINLYASPEVIYGRLKNGDSRPLLKCGDPLAEIRWLLSLRKSFYEDCNFAFNTDGLTPSEVADIILDNASLKALLF